MSKYIGRKYSIGFGKEASTTRGTAVAISFWTPKMDVSVEEKIGTVINDASIATIADAENMEVVSKYCEGSLTGRLEQTAFGLLLTAAFGTEAVTAVGGETLVYDHSFTVAESAQHPSLTIGVSEPNAQTTASKVYTLGMIDALEIDLEIGKYSTYKIDFRANAAATASLTPSFSAETAFLPQDGVVKFATNLAGLDAASAISVKKVMFKINKNTEDDMVIGSTTPADRLNKQIEVSGTIELIYNDRSYLDTNLNAGLAQALRIQLVNSDVTIGSNSRPTITFDMAKVILSEVARNIKNNDIVTQVLKFKAFYSIADTSMITAKLRNLQSAAY